MLPRRLNLLPGWQTAPAGKKSPDAAIQARRVRRIKRSISRIGVGLPRLTDQRVDVEELVTREGQRSPSCTRSTRSPVQGTEYRFPRRCMVHPHLRQSVAGRM